jgi:membrane-anchored protein YejM (alkaline phosphatase superfamily)
VSNLLTDYLLVLVIGGLAFDIHRQQYREEFRHNTGWVVSFVLFALAAFLGGTYHGFLEGTGSVLSETVWFSSIACIQLASFALAVTVLEQFVRSLVTRRAVEGLLLVKLILILALLTVHSQFFYVMIGYGIDLLVVLTVLTYEMVRQPSESGTWLLSGALIVPVASIIQRFPFKILDVFDQNDIYHFVLIGAFICLHRGVKLGEDTVRE